MNSDKKRYLDYQLKEEGILVVGKETAMSEAKSNSPDSTSILNPPQFGST